MRPRYDVVILGGGATGQSAALASIQKHKQVALIDEFGCGGWNNVLPGMTHEFTQAVHRWGAFEQAQQAAGDYQAAFVRYPPPKHQLQAAGVAVITDLARLIDPTTVQVGRDELSAKHLIVATGHLKVSWPIAGGQLAGPTSQLFQMRRLPKRIIAIDPDELELSLLAAFSTLGSRVNVVQTKLPTGDHALNRIQVDSLGSIEQLQRSYRLNFITQGQARSLTAEIITGRRPAGPDLRFDPHGFMSSSH